MRGDERAELRDVALDRALGGIARHRAISVLHLGRAIPLDREIVVGDVLDDAVDLGGERIGEARADFVDIRLRSGKIRGGSALLTEASDTWKRRCFGSAPCSRSVLNTK